VKFAVERRLFLNRSKGPVDFPDKVPAQARLMNFVPVKGGLKLGLRLKA